MLDGKCCINYVWHKFHLHVNASADEQVNYETGYCGENFEVIMSHRRRNILVYSLSYIENNAVWGAVYIETQRRVE